MAPQEMQHLKYTPKTQRGDAGVSVESTSRYHYVNQSLPEINSKRQISDSSRGNYQT